MTTPADPTADTGRTMQPTAAASQDAASLSRAYVAMLRIRRFEDEIQRQFLKGNVHGTTHLCNGHEAISVGVAVARGPDDVFAATYRGHGHALANGVDMTGLAAELMGRAIGTCGGRSGSMNVIDREHGLLGCFGIVGGTISTATGAALALRGSGKAAIAFFGEGATNQGYFAECLNFARVFRLPVLFVCENNLYGEYTPWEQVTAGADICGRARALDIPAERIDGNVVASVQGAAAGALERARSGAGPSLLECMTYRFVGHSRSDPALYRKEGEMEQWRERDPLVLARAALRQEHGLGDEDLAAIEARVEAEVTASFDAALAAPFPEAQEVAHA
jgi:acetoin:2,6-dichlorophenolindophenol oxidoreductase subunit alpha